MRKFMTTLAMSLLFLFSSTAQEKIAYVNITDVLIRMPERAKAQDQLSAYMRELSESLLALQYRYSAKIKEYEELPTNTLPVVKESIEREIVQMEEQINRFQQSSESQLRTREDELMAPINEKLMTSIRRVAKNTGYGHVFDTNSALVYPSKNDLTEQVIKDLGL